MQARLEVETGLVPAVVRADLQGRGLPGGEPTGRTVGPVEEALLLLPGVSRGVHRRIVPASGIQERHGARPGLEQRLGHPPSRPGHAADVTVDPVGGVRADDPDRGLVEGQPHRLGGLGHHPEQGSVGQARLAVPTPDVAVVTREPDLLDVLPDGRC